MFSRLSVLFLAFTMFACSLVTNPPTRTPVPPEQASPEILKLASDTVALVHDGHVFCSAVWIGEDTILTANHCVEGLARMLEKELDEDVDPSTVAVDYIVQREVTGFDTPPMATHMALVVKRDGAVDLALLHALGGPKVIPQHTFAHIPDKGAAVGSHLDIMGHQSGLTWSYQEGRVAAYRDMDGPVDISGLVMQVSANVWFGNSGGGAFNPDGELVGIASFIMRGPALAFFIPVDSIQAFLN